MEDILDGVGRKRLVEGAGRKRLVEGTGRKRLVEGASRKRLVERCGRKRLVESGLVRRDGWRRLSSPSSKMKLRKLVVGLIFR